MGTVEHTIRGIDSYDGEWMESGPQVHAERERFRSVRSEMLKAARDSELRARDLARGNDAKVRSIAEIAFLRASGAALATAIFSLPRTELGLGQIAVVRGLRDWPRVLQLVSLGGSVLLCLLTAANVLESELGFSLAFVALGAFFFGNFAAWRNGSPHWLTGPNISIIGVWGSVVTAAAILVNLVVG